MRYKPLIPISIILAINFLWQQVLFAYPPVGQMYADTIRPLAATERPESAIITFIGTKGTYTSQKYFKSSDFVPPSYDDIGYSDQGDLTFDDMHKRFVKQYIKSPLTIIVKIDLATGKCSYPPRDIPGYGVPAAVLQKIRMCFRQGLKAPSQRGKVRLYLFNGTTKDKQFGSDPYCLLDCYVGWQDYEYLYAAAGSGGPATSFKLPSIYMTQELFKALSPQHLASILKEEASHARQKVHDRTTGPEQFRDDPDRLQMIANIRQDIKSHKSGDGIWRWDNLVSPPGDIAPIAQKIYRFIDSLNPDIQDALSRMEQYTSIDAMIDYGERPSYWEYPRTCSVATRVGCLAIKGALPKDVKIYIARGSIIAPPYQGESLHGEEGLHHYWLLIEIKGELYYLGLTDGLFAWNADKKRNQLYKKAYAQERWNSFRDLFLSKYRDEFHFDKIIFRPWFDVAHHFILTPNGIAGIEDDTENNLKEFKQVLTFASPRLCTAITQGAFQYPHSVYYRLRSGGMRQDGARLALENV